jgi:predicted ATPase
LRVTLASLRRQFEPPDLGLEPVFIADRRYIRVAPSRFYTDVSEFESAVESAARATTAQARDAYFRKAAELYVGELMPGIYDEWVLEERNRLDALFAQVQEAIGRTTPERSVAPDLPFIAPERVGPSAPESVATGLPLYLTRYFGRTVETNRLIGLLADKSVRLITVTGPSGVGKSRFTVETARSAAATFDGLVKFVPLANLSDGSLIMARIADALDVSLAGEDAPSLQIAAAFRSGRSLLLLDNMEHLGHEAAAAVVALLEEAPGLTCVCTSQSLLEVGGEHELALSPLSAPAVGEATAELVRIPSIQLFLDRAQSLKPDFQITSANGDGISEICRQLEGLPLALELAAARINVIGIAQMCRQLSSRLDFVTSRRRDLAPRHRSLRAALEWSTQQLSSEQLRFFKKLSVFRGGWQLESAIAVCGESNALDQLDQLRVRSLIVTEEGAFEIRYRMLESLREFCQEQLSSPEKRAVSRLHAAYFVDLAQRMDGIWNGPRQQEAARILEAETDNLRSALQYCRLDGGDEDWDSAELGLTLSACLSRYWTVRGMGREGIEWLRGSLARGGSPAARIRALRELGWLQVQVDDFSEGTGALAESIALCRRHGEIAGLGIALRLLGCAEEMRHRHGFAIQYLEEALEISRSAGDEINVAGSLLALAGISEHDGDWKKARSLFEEALRIYRRCGNHGNAAYCVHNLGNIAFSIGELALAESLHRESLKSAVELGDIPFQAYCSMSLGEVLESQGDLDRAEQNLREARRILAEVSDRRAESKSVSLLGDVARHRGDTEAASALYHESLSIRRDIGDTAGLAASWIGLAEIAIESERWNQAVGCLAKASRCGDAEAIGPATARAAAACSAVLDGLSVEECVAIWEQAVGAEAGARWLRDAMSRRGGASRDARKKSIVNEALTRARTRARRAGSWRDRGRGTV